MNSCGRESDWILIYYLFYMGHMICKRHRTTEVMTSNSTASIFFCFHSPVLIFPMLSFIMSKHNSPLKWVVMRIKSCEILVCWSSWHPGKSEYQYYYRILQTWEMLSQIASRIKIRKRICQPYVQSTLLFCPSSSPVHALFSIVHTPHQYAEHYVPGRELLHRRVCADKSKQCK